MKLTDSPAALSVSTIVRVPPEIVTAGDTLGASTVIVAVVVELLPSSSVALKVTTVELFGNAMIAFKPVATSAPSTNHWVVAIVPSLSVAVAVKLIDSPAALSVSEIVREPPEIVAAGDILDAVSYTHLRAHET